MGPKSRFGGQERGFDGRNPVEEYGGAIIYDGMALMVLLYAATLFVSSVLLFGVQPMVGKMILPTLGGTPAAWNTCMVFFQAALLAGYAYSHVTTVWLGVRRQAWLHMVVLLAPLAVLPVAAGGGTPPSEGGNPAWWLLWRLAVTTGLPFFVVATSAPLLQRWFVGTGHPGSKDPYFLYAASNLGSLLALLGYPLVVERSLWIAEQSRLWSVGYGLLMGMMLICAVMVWRSKQSGVAARPPADSTTDDRATCRPTARLRMWWVITAFVPSSLMLGVTSYMTTNLAAVPLLWVIPLALYLLTFVLVFARRQLLPHRLMSWALPYIVLPLALLTFLELKSMGWVMIPIHLLMFFLATMVCHGELARSRPAAKYLTEFYLWMSIGGVLGGLFNALFAPVVFTTLIEYPLIMVVALLFRMKGGSAQERPRDRKLDLLLPIGLGVFAVAMAVGVQVVELNNRVICLGLVFMIPAMICFSFKERPLRFGLGFGAVLLVCGYYMGLRMGREVYAERNFFGVKRVLIGPEGKYRMLVHGGILHGCQNIVPEAQLEPLSYYHPTGPIGDVFEVLREDGSKPEVAIIGLGCGAMAHYAQKDQRFTFYEIDPEVEAIARDPELFGFMQACRGSCEVVLGDGRLRLARARDEQFGLIILDAFGSDAIPTHLLSREALQLYLSKLSEHGQIVFHVSNRYLNLHPVLKSLAAEAKLVCVERADEGLSEKDTPGKLPSQYVAMARSREDVAKLLEEYGWSHVPGDPTVAAWTDQYSNLLGLVRWF